MNLPIMNARTAAALRALAAQTMVDQKHDHNFDFGYPDHIVFEQLHNMWQRNSLANSGVSRYVTTCWQEDPKIQEGEEAGDESKLEQELREHFDDLRLWQKFSSGHERSLVGDYSAVILRVADGRDWAEPVGPVAGVQGLWDMIPAWEAQLTVGEWDLNPQSRRYGQPLFYNFNEVALGDQKQQGAVRSFRIHHDRIILLSSSGDLQGSSILRPGYNDLLTYAKVIGAGGEGFWKAARSSLSMEILPEAKLNDLASALGVPLSGLPDRLDEVVGDFLKGYDKSLMLQGIKATPIGVTLPTNPEQYYNGPLQAFAASIDCPSKVLIGNQTGERASTEDERSWKRTCASHRNRRLMPPLRDMLSRFERWGILPQGDWKIDWFDVTEATGSERMDTALKMADVNAKVLGIGDVPFSGAEIREAAGWEDAGDLDGPDDSDPLGAGDGT